MFLILDYMLTNSFWALASGVSPSTYLNNEGSLFTMKDIQCFYQLQELLSLNLAYIACVSMATRVEEWRAQHIHTIYILWHHVSNHSMCVWLLNHFHLGPIMPLPTNILHPTEWGFSETFSTHFDQFPGKPFFPKDSNIKLAISKFFVKMCNL